MAKENIKRPDVQSSDLDTTKFSSFIRDPKTGKCKGVVEATKPSLTTKERKDLLNKGEL
jgi:hypothetical protein